MERLQKIISAYGICSRRKAEEYITAGKVLVNGKVASLGQSADPERDKIIVAGKKLINKPKHVYIMLNKPRGYVVTMDDEKGRKNVTELLKGLNCRVYPVGRLDINSEGLLILTNDGEFANKLIHPRHEMMKFYDVSVTGAIEDGLKKLSELRFVDELPIQPCSVEFLKTYDEKHMIRIGIWEGRNHQIRKMCTAANLEVKRLRRVAIGELTLTNLAVGKWRFLAPAELELLQTPEI